MKLCVLMPVHNEERFIGTAIASILAARDALQIEIVIVDDGSSDNTAGVIEEIAAAHGGIRLIRTENRGVAHARNQLLDAIPTTCDFATFLDGDDAFAPGYLEKYCQILVDDPTLELTYAQMCLIKSDKQDMSTEPREDALISRTISMSIGIYRPSLLKKTGQFDAEFFQAEDTDFLLRLFELGPNAHLGEDIAVFYRQHGANITKDTHTARRGFARAMLRHIQRRKANPHLASVAGVFSISQLGTDMRDRRA